MWKNEDTNVNNYKFLLLLQIAYIYLKKVMNHYFAPRMEFG